MTIILRRDEPQIDATLTTTNAGWAELMRTYLSIEGLGSPASVRMQVSVHAVKRSDGKCAEFEQTVPLGIKDGAAHVVGLLGVLPALSLDRDALFAPELSVGLDSDENGPYLIVCVKGLASTTVDWGGYVDIETSVGYSA